MENNFKELEVKKGEIEKAFTERQQYLQALDKDIELMEALINAKSERAKMVNELQNLRGEYNKICSEIAEEKLKESESE